MRHLESWAAQAYLLTRAQKQFQKTPFHCEADAKQARETCKKELAVRFHTLSVTITSSERPKKEAPIEMETIYQLSDGTKQRQFGKLTYDQQQILKGLRMSETIYL